MGVLAVAFEPHQPKRTRFLPRVCACTSATLQTPYNSRRFEAMHPPAMQSLSLSSLPCTEAFACLRGFPCSHLWRQPAGGGVPGAERGERVVSPWSPAKRGARQAYVYGASECAAAAAGSNAVEWRLRAWRGLAKARSGWERPGGPNLCDIALLSGWLPGARLGLAGVSAENNLRLARPPRPRIATRSPSHPPASPF